MNLSDEDIDLLERYAQDDLLPAERQALEERISMDADFAAEAARVAESLSAIKAAARAERRAELQAMWQEVQADDASASGSGPGRGSASRRWRWIAVAASIVLLCSIGAYWWFSPQPTQRQELFAELFTPLPASPQLRNGPGNDPAMRAYDRREYQQAEELFDLALGDSLDASRYLYMANCALELKQYRRALAHLEQARKTGSPGILEQVDWYEALTRIALGETDAARQALEAIAAGAGPYAGKAKAALPKLKELNAEGK